MRGKHLVLVVLAAMAWFGCATDPARLSGTELQDYLVKAAAEGERERVDKAFSAGADVNGRSGEGTTALIVSAYYNKLPIVKLLLERGADVNLADSGGVTAMMWASQAGHTEVVRVLLEAKPDLSLRDASGRSALAWASMHPAGAGAQLLRDAGAAE